MATFTKIPDFLENIAYGVFDLSPAANEVIKLAFSNTAPAAEASPTTDSGNGILANVSQISYTNYTDDLAVDRILTDANITSVEGSGVYKLDYTEDIIITAAIGALPTWRYLYLWDDTPSSPADPLLGAWDHGSAIDLALGESATLVIHANGFITLS